MSSAERVVLDLRKQDQKRIVEAVKALVRQYFEKGFNMGWDESSRRACESEWDQFISESELNTAVWAALEVK